jgi:hypothetical protein
MEEICVQCRLGNHGKCYGPPCGCCGANEEK